LESPRSAQFSHHVVDVAALDNAMGSRSEATSVEEVTRKDIAAKVKHSGFIA
jgi:hypothetical protein